MTETQRVIRFAAHAVGMVKDSDFVLGDEAVPAPGEGEVLVRTVKVGDE